MAAHHTWPNQSDSSQNLTHNGAMVYSCFEVPGEYLCQVMWMQGCLYLVNIAQLTTLKDASKSAIKPIGPCALESRSSSNRFAHACPSAAPVASPSEWEGDCTQYMQSRASISKKQVQIWTNAGIPTLQGIING